MNGSYAKKVVFGSLMFVIVMAVAAFLSADVFSVSAASLVTSLGDDMDIMGGLTTGGNIGIRTTRPIATLDIENSSDKRTVYLAGTPTASAGSAFGIYSSETLTATAHNDALYSFRIDPIASVGAFTGSVLYGLFISTPSGAGSNYALYSAGGTNYFGGNVGIGTASPTAKLDVAGNTLRLEVPKTPASSSEACNQGDIAWDTNSLYVCVTQNTWKKSALVSF